MIFQLFSKKPIFSDLRDPSSLPLAFRTLEVYFLFRLIVFALSFQSKNTKSYTLLFQYFSFLGFVLWLIVVLLFDFVILIFGVGLLLGFFTWIFGMILLLDFWWLLLGFFTMWCVTWIFGIGLTNDHYLNFCKADLMSQCTSF